MVAKDYQRNKGSGKAEVGEIDTSVPFQSVKDAVTLFGEGAFSSGEKPAIRKSKTQSAERVLAKETQLHLAQKELNKLQENFKNAESTKAHALLELERAKRTVEALTSKLHSINESKDLAMRAAEVAKHQAKQFLEANSANCEGTGDSSVVNLETVKVQYMVAASQLDAAKQELMKIRQQHDASVEAKQIATKQATEAENAAKANMGRIGELSKEFTGVLESIEQVKLASSRTKEEEAKIQWEKEKQKQSHKARLEESEKELNALKKTVDPDQRKNLETQLIKTLSGVQDVRVEIDNAKAAVLDSVKSVASELDDAKESLHKVAKEENALRRLVENLKIELDNIKKEHSELKEKEAETESAAGNIHVKLQKAKSELEEALAEEAKVNSASDEMIATIHQLASESENAKHEAERTKLEAEELKKLAEAARIELEEAEKKVKVAVYEADEAKTAEARALDQIKMLSEKTDARRTSISEPGANITISREEFESLNRKIEESEKLAEMKVAAAMAQVEAVKASENEALKRLEATQEEIEDMKAATQEALKKAEMAEAAKKAVEGELRRWHEREQKKAAEAASRILTQTDKLFELSPHNNQIRKPKRPEKVMETRKLEKAKTSVAKKVLMPSLSSVFHKKKNQVDGGSPSYLPGEKPVW